jgi:hypothetical protein
MNKSSDNDANASGVLPDNNDSTIISKISTRKTQAWVAIISIAVALFGFIYYRCMSNCETIFRSIETNIIGGITMIAFFGLGIGWYYALSSIGEDRLSDLFGIANRLLPPGALVNGPVACVPTPVCNT